MKGVADAVPMRIEKKAWPEFFQKMIDGEKNFELRLADIREGFWRKKWLMSLKPKMQNSGPRKMLKNTGFR